MMFYDVRKMLFSLQEMNVICYYEKVVPNLNNVIGVRVPKLRKIAKAIVKENYIEYLKFDEDLYFEELIIQGMIIGLLNLDEANLKKYVDFYLNKISNWALCDVFVGNLKCLKKYKIDLFDYFLSMLSDYNEFKKRFVFVVFLTYYVDEKYVDKLISAVSVDKDDRYYVVMAKAWLMSVIYFKFKSKVMAELSNHSLDFNTHNKTIQKITASLKCTDFEKNVLKSMKVKL